MNCLSIDGLNLEQLNEISGLNLTAEQYQQAKDMCEWMCPAEEESEEE